ncbi:MAG: ACT domain-containing protein [Actinomycetota bacterium]
MKEFSVTLANRPGQLATLARRLSTAGVHIESLAAIGADGEGLVRFMPDDADVARRVLREAGLSFEERPVLDTFLPDEPGALADVAQRLADAGVNIDSLYLLHSNAEGLHFAITVDDPEAARANLA